MYAYCIVEYPVKSLDKAFTYKIPLNLQEKLKVGMKVLVPFNNRLVHGIVLKITDIYEKTYELKEISSIEDEFLVLNKELLESEVYPCHVQSLNRHLYLQLQVFSYESLELYIKAP